MSNFQSYQAPVTEASQVEPQPIPGNAPTQEAPKPVVPTPEAPKPAEGQEPPKPEAPKPEAPKPDAPKPEADKLQEAPKGDWAYSKFSDEYAEKGALSEDSYKELAEKHGLPKGLVDDWIEGRKAIAASQEAQSAKDAQEIHAVVGGEEQYQVIGKWAVENLSKDEVDAFNSTLETGSVAQIKTALRGLQASYQEANGVAPSVRVAGNPSPSGIKPYADKAEMKKDMSSPEYRKSQAFRDSVAQRLAVSTVI